MMEDKAKAKKPSKGLSLLIGLGRKKADSGEQSEMGKESDEDMGSGPESSPDAGMDMDAASMAAEDLAEQMGVAEDKRSEFASSFKNAVRACVDSLKDEDSGSESTSPMSMGSKF